MPDVIRKYEDLEGKEADQPFPGWVYVTTYIFAEDGGFSMGTGVNQELSAAQRAQIERRQKGDL